MVPGRGIPPHPRPFLGCRALCHLSVRPTPGLGCRAGQAPPLTYAPACRYQQILHRNLVYLATIADSNQNMQSLLPAVSAHQGWWRGAGGGIDTIGPKLQNYLVQIWEMRVPRSGRGSLGSSIFSPVIRDGPGGRGGAGRLAT